MKPFGELSELLREDEVVILPPSIRSKGASGSPPITSLISYVTTFPIKLYTAIDSIHFFHSSPTRPIEEGGDNDGPRSRKDSLDIKPPLNAVLATHIPHRSLHSTSNPI